MDCLLCMYVYMNGDGARDEVFRQVCGGLHKMLNGYYVLEFRAIKIIWEITWFINCKKNATHL